MKAITFLLCLFYFVNCHSQNQKEMKTIYDFKVEDISGNEFDFSTLKGKKILIVNTASKCGYTPQFEGLEKLYQTYKDQNFVVIGFPSNDFGQQDPGNNQEIAEFCQLNYGVSFPMMSKIVVTGDEMAPIYQFLTNEKLNGKKNSTVKWNFQKYLINEDGTFENFYLSATLPNDNSIIEWIENK